MDQLSEGAILCTIDVVGLDPNIPPEEGLAFLKSFLDERTEKKVTTEILVELAETVLKNNIFQINEKTFTAISTKFVHRMQFYLWLTLKSFSKKTFNYSHAYCGGILLIHFFICELGKDFFKKIIKQLMSFIPLSNSLRNGQKKK